MRSRLIKVACVAILCLILDLGLRPFHAPRNDVSWLRDRNGLHIYHDARGTGEGTGRARNRNRI